jgi:hypothetical protein
MSDGQGPGYVPGSVWVPWSIVRPERRPSRRRRAGWLSLFFQRSRSELYQRCFAFNFGQGKRAFRR